VKTPRILLVEPDILARTPLAEYLRECGFQVLEAADAAEAQTLLEDTSRQVDVVLADIDADDQSVFALARWVRKRLPGVEMILVGTVTKAAQKAGDLCQDGPALSKPYDHQLALDHIRRLMASRKRDDGIT
jgi:DNA-binding NtrC family response regulator